MFIKKSKGQAGIPAILLVSLLLILFYIMWVKPSERNVFLDINTTKPGVSSSVGDSSADFDDYFLKTNVGYVGRKTGRLIDTFNFEDFVLDYGQKENFVVRGGSAVLISNVFSSSEFKTVIGEDFNSLYINFTASEIKGNPSVIIKSGEVELFEQPLKENQFVELSLASTKLPGNDLKIVCKFSSFNIFSGQKCDLSNVNVVVNHFEKIVPIQSFSFIANEKLVDQGGEVRLSFKVSKSVLESPLTVNVNKVLVDEDYYSNRSSEYLFKSNVNELGIVQGANSISFETNEGGVYSIKDAKLRVYEVSIEESSKTIYFEVDDVIDSGSSYVLSFDVLNIIEPGFAEFNVGDHTYVVSKTNMIEGVNLINIQGSDLVKGGNRLRIDSSSGRFEIGELKLKK